MPFLTFSGQENKGKTAQIPSARSTPQPSHPKAIGTHPISHLSTSKVRSTLRCAIPRHHAPLEECFPFVLRNHLTMYSPCSYFDISSTGEGGQISNKDGGGEGTADSPPLPVVRGGKGSPEGDVVAATRPGGKCRVPHPGGPPIYGGQRRQRQQQKSPRKGGVWRGWGSGGGVSRSLSSLLGTRPFLDLTAK